MTLYNTDTQKGTHRPSWIPLTRSFSFLFGHFRILLLSLLLFAVTIVVAWLFYQISAYCIDLFIARHFTDLPASDSFLGWVNHYTHLVFKWIFIIASQIISIYIAMLFAYSLTTPGYAFLSAAVERISLGGKFNDETLSIHGLAIDFIEGCKIGLFGAGITLVALFVNFIPAIGQFLVFFLYCYYSSLMFIDYPASRRRWSLGRKILWLWNNPVVGLRLGFLPALVSFLPIVNLFFMAILFPVLTIHATLNFTVLDSSSTDDSAVTHHGQL